MHFTSRHAELRTPRIRLSTEARCNSALTRESPWRYTLFPNGTSRNYKRSCDLRWRVERTVPKTQLETATRPGVQSGLFYDIPTGSYLSDKFSHTARNFSHTFKCSRRAHILLGYWTSPWYVPHHCQWHHRGMWMRTSKYE